MTVSNEKLQRARLEKHWSVATASRKVGVSANTFNRWERGLQIPQLATLDQLCAAFGMSAEDLGFGYVVLPPKKAEVDFLLEEDGTEIAPQLPLTAVSAGLEACQVVTLCARRSGVAVAGVAAPEQVLVDVHCSRRQAMVALIGTPAAVFSGPQGDTFSLLKSEEVLALCATHIPLCWQLYFEGGMADVEQVLPNYLTQLTHLLHTFSQKQAASLLSQAYQLASLMATQHQDYGRAWADARQALFYGELADDANLQVASLIRCALVDFYLKRTRPRLLAYQQALKLAPRTSPLLLGRTYIGLAEAWSKLGQESEARHFLDLAQRTFPHKAEEDVNFACTHFTFTSISTFEGRMYLNLKQPALAQEAFARIDQAISRDAVPNRLELFVHQAFTAYALGELERTSELIELTIPMARTLGSQLRMDQAYEIYEQMLGKWSNEYGLRNLDELFH